MRRVVGMSVAVVCVSLAFANDAPAQPERYELGRRLRAFEAAWEKSNSTEATQRAVAPLKQAVQLFFRFRFGDAGRAIDQARFAVESDKLPEAARLWAESIAVFPEKRFLDAAEKSLKLSVRPFYEVTRPTDVKPVLRLRIVDARNLAAATHELPLKETTTAIDWGLEKLPEGDHQLRYEVRVEGKVLASGSIGVSAAARLADRLAALDKRVPEAPTSTDEATQASHVALLRRLADGKAEETDYPAARLLTEAELIERKRAYFDRTRPGEFWLTLACRRDPKAKVETVPVRILVPGKSKDKALPLVIALHGAGGSENLFFDGYGGGKIVRLCRDRDWLLVAPRGGLFGGGAALPPLIDEIDRLYPVDRRRVFLIGHSMGAAQAVRAASADPGRYAGVVALGGGGSTKPSESLKKLPFFIGCGVEDFAIAGARNLRQQLAKAGVEQLTMKEYDSIEHLGIVQHALEDAFRFYDSLARATDK